MPKMKTHMGAAVLVTGTGKVMSEPGQPAQVLGEVVETEAPSDTPSPLSDPDRKRQETDALPFLV